MNSEDYKYTNAAFIIKSKAHLALLQENNSDNKNMQSNDASQSELGEEDPVESDEESDVDKISVAPEVSLVTMSTDSVALEELSFEDVTVNSWVLVLCEGEKFLGQCLSKMNGKFQVQCLLMPYGIRPAQVFEKEVAVVYYNPHIKTNQGLTKTN